MFDPVSPDEHIIVADGPAWRVVGNSTALKGFALGSRYPMLVATIGGHKLTGAQRAAVIGRLREALPALEGAAETLPPEESFAASIEWLLATMDRLQLAAELPVYERGRLLAGTSDQARICLPTTENALLPLHQVLLAVLELVQAEARGDGYRHGLARLTEALAELRKAAALGLNVPKFIRAALELGMPFQALTGVFQYGHGRRGRWLDSTFTDETSFIGATLARNKHLAARVLRAAGIPVPDHVVVDNVDAALAAAARLGYPVVVKPADRDGNLGVSADLQSPAEVTAAFQRARPHSALILVEKHVAGDDCRIVVFHGDVIWAHRRLPAGVVGNGRHSIAALVDALNAEPRRGTGAHAEFRMLPLDEEAGEMLQRAGLAANTVPAEGQFVRLRRASNQRNGGLIEPVLERMHPDNQLLAARAARALHLDIAGVDLIIPDIARSWRETGAAINDVNGQPGTRQIAEHLPAQILRALVPGDGRVPTVVVLGAAPNAPLVQGIETLLRSGQVIAGCHDTAGVRVNGQVVMQGAVSAYDAGMALSVDRSVGAIVLSIQDDSVLGTGLPIPRFDVLVLAGAHILPHSAAPETPNLLPVLQDLLSSILPACDGIVVTIDQSGLEATGFAHLTPARWQHVPAQADSFYRTVMDGLREAEARHAAPPNHRPTA
jgi:cyanophycin synthetase